MPISDIKRSVIPPTAARLQHQDLTNKPFSAPMEDHNDNQTSNTPSFEEELEQHSPHEEFNGYDPLGQSIPMGLGWCVLDTIDNLVEQTIPPMDIHELNIRLKLKRQEGDLIKRLPPPTPTS